jgi:hypothetical protein
VQIHLAKDILAHKMSPGGDPKAEKMFAELRWRNDYYDVREFQN